MNVRRARRASMRPPDLPGGNQRLHASADRRTGCHPASMRPPDLPGGNQWTLTLPSLVQAHWRFNEAAGFTRRKQRTGDPQETDAAACFNEAAGFTRRKPTESSWARRTALPCCASMRPPDLPGGNIARAGQRAMRRHPAALLNWRFNVASMRPPDLPGGNEGTGAPLMSEQSELQ